MKFKNYFETYTKKVEKSMNEQIQEEVEELQLQINTLRQQLNKKEKKRFDQFDKENRDMLNIERNEFQIEI